jgi:hypothetical protein
MPVFLSPIPLFGKFSRETQIDPVGEFTVHAPSDVKSRVKLSTRHEFANGITNRDDIRIVFYA